MIGRTWRLVQHFVDLGLFLVLALSPMRPQSGILLCHFVLPASPGALLPSHLCVGADGKSPCRIIGKIKYDTVAKLPHTGSGA